MHVVKNADRLRKTSDSKEFQGAQWEEPEFEFDDIGIDLEAVEARHISGKIRELWKIS